MARCRYTRHRTQGDVDGVTLRLSALWLVIREPPPDDDGVLVDDQLLDWVARAGARRGCLRRQR